MVVRLAYEGSCAAVAETVGISVHPDLHTFCSLALLDLLPQLFRLGLGLEALIFSFYVCF